MSLIQELQQDSLELQGRLHALEERVHRITTLATPVVVENAQCAASDMDVKKARRNGSQPPPPNRKGLS